MRKSLFFLLISLAFTNLLTAKTWTNNIGTGATVSVLSLGTDENTMGIKNTNQVGYGLEGTYVGLHENGLTAKVNVSFGLATSKDISIQQNKHTNLGVFENVALGLGYAFIKNENFLFAVTGMVGIELGQYSVESDDEDYNGVTYSNLKKSLSLASCSLGADIFGIYRLTEYFGIFGNLAARYVIAGNAKLESQYSGTKKNSDNITVSRNSDLKGNFVVQPTVGVIWTF
jgi:hypothetical protein